MSELLKNKTALITGASRGLGASIARCLWNDGADLILVARSTEKLSALRNELLASAKLQQSIEIIAVDLANPDAVTNFIVQLEVKKIDILVNNAGILGPVGPTWENNWQDWLTTMQINLLTPVALCRALVAKMVKQNYGKIINLSGGGATAPRANFSAYSVAKSGLVRFSETLADEVKSFSIAVNCIAPGMMNTDMLTEFFAAGIEKIGAKDHNQIQKVKATSNDSTLLNAAKLCAFLASSASDGITGKLISAVWDPWAKLPDYLTELSNSDIYTLRRIVPKDRGKEWGEVT